MHNISTHFVQTLMENISKQLAIFSEIIFSQFQLFRFPNEDHPLS